MSAGRKILIGSISFFLDVIDFLGIFDLGNKVYQKEIDKFKNTKRDSAWRHDYAPKL